jgi:hypothetical protein
MHRFTRASVYVGLAACCLMMASCSGNPTVELEASGANLSGTVTLNGRPVPYAMIIASGESGSAQALSDEGGNYKIENVPLGAVKIGVNTDAGKGMMMGKVQAAQQGHGEAPTFVSVSEKYFLPESSGLTTNVAEGENTFAIELK